MKIVRGMLSVALVGLFILTPFFLYAEETGETKRVLEIKDKSLLESIWFRVRKLSPKRPVPAGTTAVAGVKGAEKGSENLKPAWKGDLSEKAATELETFSIAENLMDEGKFSEALVAFGSFKADYPLSQYLPNAEFLSAICQLNMNLKEEATETLEKFLKEYPDHELKKDAFELRSSL